MKTSVIEYIDLLYERLGKLAFEEIKYSDYDEMTDWLAGIGREVKRLEKRDAPMKPTKERTRYGMVYDCNVCNCGLETNNNYCPNCGQAIDWED